MIRNIKINFRNFSKNKDELALVKYIAFSFDDNLNLIKIKKLEEFVTRPQLRKNEPKEGGIGDFRQAIIP